jgi:endonuclease/exonuclease/phosphatase family metal-dependent hydrolase
MVFLALSLLGLGATAHGQWAPRAGAWGKDDPTDLRVMTWNAHDTLCSTNAKLEGAGDWCAMARIVAALRPDVLVVQEAGDNAGHGTGLMEDSAGQLATVLGLFVHGGADPFAPGAPPVGSYVQLYAPGYDLPFVFASFSTDGFNRNAVLSRFPFADLNGDGKATLSNMPTVSADLYAPGGTGGLRGYLVAEIDLPDALYAGDLVVGNSHLKAGTSAADHDQRVVAAQNIAYFLDHLYNGAGLGVPDPFGTIADAPPATSILGSDTLVVTGGDWNEDEDLDGSKGPAEWITRAAVADAAGGTDGTDRDRSDMLYDAALDPLSGASATLGPFKFDALAWQDSIAELRRAFLFNSASLPFDGSATPRELADFPGGAQTASGLASDHRPVVIDLALPRAECNIALDLGLAKPGGGGLAPRFTVCGSLASGGTADVRLLDAAPLAPAWLVASLASGGLPFAGGVLVPLPDFLVGPFATDATGALEFGAVPGGGGPLLLYAQWIVLDRGASYGKSLSNALLVAWRP